MGRGIEIAPILADFTAFCEEAVDKAREGHPQAAFRTDFPAPCEAEFDPARMRQVIGNLLSNALQHGDRKSPIVIAMSDGAEDLSLRVTNTGVPIPANALQVIFNPLVQVPGGPTEPHERPSTSMGLGLFIAREIVEAHGGTIDATSTASSGTTFTIHLPRRVGVRPN